MIVQRSAMYLGILIVLLVSMRGQTSPVNSKKEGKSGCNPRKYCPILINLKPVTGENLS